MPTVTAPPPSSESTTAATGPPVTTKPRRRKWIIAALLLLAAATWWYWPRGDHRLVGRWNYGAVEFEQATMRCTFSSNGLMWFSGLKQLGGQLSSWRVEGNELIIEPVGGQRMDRVWGWINDWSVWFDIEFNRTPIRFEVIEMEPDRVRCRTFGPKPFDCEIQRIKD
jgi:hypothetical protein